MARVRFTSLASADLHQIIRYFQRIDRQAAAALIERFETTCQQLLQHPKIGFARPELAPDLRSFVVGNYLIFYRERTGDLQVIRILHGARDYGPRDF